MAAVVPAELDESKPRSRRGSWSSEGSLMYAAVEAHEDMDEDAPTEVKAGWYQLVVWALFAVGAHAT